MKKLTREQTCVFNTIKEYIDKNGYSPSVRDLCKLTGKSSPATIHFHLKKLKEKGYINYVQGTNRTIRINEQDEPIKKHFKFFRKWW